MKRQALYQLIIVMLFSFTTLLAPAQQRALPAIKVDSLVNFYKKADGIMVVNFWSTWCKPCVEEIPHFIAVTNKYKDNHVELLLVSQDTKALYESGKLLAYIKKAAWNNANMVWLNETNAEYYCPKVDETWSGVIPASLIIKPASNYYKFFEESLTAEQLEAEIKKAIND